MGCKSVPTNQTITWYKTALENYGRGNGGEGKDYDIEELKQEYYTKCNKLDENNYKRLMKIAEEMPDD